ncbi:MAG TPA: phenylacetate--CoA ligase family protein [Methanocella sp.]|nr:phenylacetate--CoA ligase family protein [Methanocella sp.]
MLDRLKFVAAHEAGHGGFYPDYRRLRQNERRPLGDLEAEQKAALRRMLQYACDNVPYYHRLFRVLNFDPAKFRDLDDLQQLPILTKETVKKHYDEMISSRIRRIPHIEETTGGSTGTPMKYLVSQRDRMLSGALLYRGWGYAGYELGDRMVFLAGMSLGVSTKRQLLKSAHEFFRNIRKLSTLNMGEQEMRGFVDVISSFRPRFIRGYASSVYAFARWAQHNDVRIHQPKAVFTTSEKLYPRMRDTIAGVFGCDVFDGYGLYDGGLTAFECAEHRGMHIDMERSVMELVDDDGRQVEAGQGRIIATSLVNNAMPLIRYDTDDIGIVGADPCPCGRPYPLLQEICGRSGDFLYTPEGRAVHSLLFAYIFDELPWVKEYQVVQERLDRITIRVIPDHGFDERKLENARALVQKQSDAWHVDFSVVGHIEKTQSGKYKYIINNMINNQN